MDNPEGELVIASLNIQGQSCLNLGKQIQIEDFIKYNNIDILHCQEISISPDSFNSCKYICNNFNIIQNNSPNNPFGTASLVRSDLNIENVRCDTEGRALVFDIANITFGNFYIPSGNEKHMRQKREEYFSKMIPELLVRKKKNGIICADFNSIIDKKDATNNAEQKLSPSLKRLVNVFSMKDSFRTLHPEVKIFSRYYRSEEYGDGATRIDRSYHFGEVVVKEAD